MTRAEYCSYEISRSLQELGFDEECSFNYIIEVPGTRHEEWDDVECQMCEVADIERIPKPTLWEAQKWLRDKMHVIVLVDYMLVPIDKCRRWKFSISDNVGLRDTPKDHEFYKTYEHALSNGIEAAIHLISDRVSQSTIQ